jgi:hypothetical protein
LRAWLRANEPVGNIGAFAENCPRFAQQILARLKTRLRISEQQELNSHGLHSTIAQKTGFVIAGDRVTS